MPYLTELDKADYAVLLAANRMDAASGTLFGSNIMRPDSTKRTILIGVGGMGVRTIDYVKGAISKRLDGSWDRYVAFLAVDTDWIDLSGAAYLDQSECVNVTKEGIANRMRSPKTYPSAIRRFAVSDEDMKTLGGILGCPGAGRNRLVGKLKVHDKVPGGIGVDEEIVQKLANIKADQLAVLTDDHGKYQVYVIGSVFGGTCGGMVTEMPSLIRKVFPNPSQVSVNAMLYLPDNMAHVCPAHAGQLYANGYATLKELNYYMGMYMRPEYPETWSYHNPATPKLTYTTSCMSQEGFFNTPYLIGTKGVPSVDASREAVETVSRFLINSIIHGFFFGGTADAAFAGHTAHAAGEEAAGEAHEFPKRFATIGFAEAAVPQKALRAYMLGRVCSMAGLKPVPVDERAALRAAEAADLLSFRGKYDLLNAVEGTVTAQNLLAPLDKIVRIIDSGKFSFSEDLGEYDITWKKISNNQYEIPATYIKTNMIISQRTSAAELGELRDWIKKAFREFRNNVQNFVRKEGPYAFVNLYFGKFNPVGDNYGLGIGRMLQNLVDGKQINGKHIHFISVEDAKSELDAARSNIVSQAPGFLGIQGRVHRDQCERWVAAFNRWAETRINQVRRNVALGHHGALAQDFLLPAARLAEELDAFGCILETMTEIYQDHGRPMEDYQSFCAARDNRTEVNLAAFSASAYAWLKRQADNSVKSVDFRKIRDIFVDHFFGKGLDGMPNSIKWLEVPPHYITTSATGRIKLTAPDTPIPAREIFDEIITQEFNAGIDTSIEEIFRHSGPDFQRTANAVIQELYARSKLQFNGRIPADCCQNILVYPGVLNGSFDGQRIVQALTNAVVAVCPNVQFYSSNEAEKIEFCQVAQHMEIYRLRDLRMWEREYEKSLSGKYNSYLHGLSPDVTETEDGWYEEKIPWADYPSITVPDQDPRVHDPRTGEIIREGEILRQLDKMIARARSLGILYSENTVNGWIIKRAYFDVDIDWKADFTMLSTDSAAGLWLGGRDLVEAIAIQNGKTLADISRTVRLEHAGILSMPSSNEELAWQRAARVLRAHVPMYIEVRESLHKIETWKKEMSAETYDGGPWNDIRPAKFLWLLMGQVLYRNDDGAWYYADEYGDELRVADLSEIMIRFMAPKERSMIENGLLTYYLYKKLTGVIGESYDNFQTAYQRARNNIDRWVEDHDLDKLTAADTWQKTVLAERDVLIEKGACLDGGNEVKSVFDQALPMFNTDQLKDIQQFYFRLGEWEKI